MAFAKYVRASISALALAACVHAAPSASSPARRNAETRTIRMPISRHAGGISKRQDYHIAALKNDVLRYYVQVDVGTPPQTISLELDTGSSDTWVLSSTGCSDIDCVYGYFDSTQSSTYALANTDIEFAVSYVDGSKATGNYFNDDIRFAGTSLTALEMGLSTSASGTLRNGIMGVSFAKDEAEYSRYGQTYPTIIETMVTQGVIDVHAYSLYLDDLDARTGEIIFGGYDKTKWSGDMVFVPIVPGANAGFWVDLHALSITDSSGSTTLDTSTALPNPVLLDSGTSLVSVPAAIYAPISKYFNVGSDYSIDCNFANVEGTVDFTFDGVTISVPFSEMALVLDKSGTCSFAFREVADGAPVILGDPFLRSTYVYYDLDDRVCGLAQTVYK